jgi:hypothetical protein
MSIPNPLKQYHFHAILIWWHSPFNLLWECGLTTTCGTAIVNIQMWLPHFRNLQPEPDLDPLESKSKNKQTILYHSIPKSGSGWELRQCGSPIFTVCHCISATFLVSPSTIPSYGRNIAEVRVKISCGHLCQLSMSFTLFVYKCLNQALCLLIDTYHIVVGCGINKLLVLLYFNFSFRPFFSGCEYDLSWPDGLSSISCPKILDRYFHVAPVRVKFYNYNFISNIYIN